MAEHKYVSLKDVLKDESIPQLKLGEPIVESQDELDFEFVSKNSRISKFPSSPSFSLLGSCWDKRMMKMTTKMGLGARVPSLKHSRSDDPLVYVECHEEDDDDDPFHEMETPSQEMKNFSWEEWILKSIFPDEDEEDDM